jgi:hypothetical protein
MEIIKYNRNTNNKTKGKQSDRRKKKKSLTELNADNKAKMYENKLKKGEKMRKRTNTGN